MSVKRNVTVPVGRSGRMVDRVIDGLRPRTRVARPRPPAGPRSAPASRRSRRRGSRPSRRRRARGRCSAERVPPSPGRTRSVRSGSGGSSATCSPVTRAAIAASASGRSCQRLYVSAMIPTSGRPASSSSARASAIVLTNETVSCSAGWAGSRPKRTPASRAAAAISLSPSTTSSRARSGSRSPTGPVRQSTDSGSYAASRRTLAQSAAIRSCGSGGPSMPGRRSGRIDGTVGMQFATARPALAQQLEVRGVVLRELHLPDADALEPGGRVGGDVLGEGRAHRRDLAEREPHRPTTGTFASSLRGSAGFVSSL